jgi:glycosyltransferase involved in cell wall biosynthesis
MVDPIEIQYSLIIATLHDNGDLEYCLSSLVELKSGPRFEVIIIDQNQDDRLVEVVAHFSNRLTITHKQVLFRSASRARNLGAELARGLWVGFPDDDCQLFPEILIEVERIACDSQVYVISGQTVDILGAPNILRWRQHQVDFDCWTMFGCLTEATLFVRRDAFIQIKGFDERFGPGAPFPAAEGIDMMNRLFAEFGDMKACYSPLVRMRHPTKVPPWNRWAVGRFYEYAIGDGALIAKNLQPHILYWGVRMIFSASIQILAFRGWRSLAFAARLIGLFRGFFVGVFYFHIKTSRN